MDNQTIERVAAELNKREPGLAAFGETFLNALFIRVGSIRQGTCEIRAVFGAMDSDTIAGHFETIEGESVGDGVETYLVPTTNDAPLIAEVILFHIREFRVENSVMPVLEDTTFRVLIGDDGNSMRIGDFFSRDEAQKFTDSSMLGDDAVHGFLIEDMGIAYTDIENVKKYLAAFIRSWEGAEKTGDGAALDNLTESLRVFCRHAGLQPLSADDLLKAVTDGRRADFMDIRAT